VAILKPTAGTPFNFSELDFKEISPLPLPPGKFITNGIFYANFYRY
jgi:hypothetical protein